MPWFPIHFFSFFWKKKCFNFIHVFLSETVPRKLPWTPKVRQKDLDSFLDYTRMKFVGFTLKDDRTTLAGLPQPIHDSVRVLNSHMYKSLAELQIEVKITSSFFLFCNSPRPQPTHKVHLVLTQKGKTVFHSFSFIFFGCQFVMIRFFSSFFTRLSIMKNEWYMNEWCVLKTYFNCIILYNLLLLNFSSALVLTWF